MRIIASKRLTAEERIKGTVEPKLSHRNPAKIEPSIIPKLPKVVTIPIAVPLKWDGIISEIHALEIPSVEAA